MLLLHIPLTAYEENLFGSPLWQLFTSAVAWLYFAHSFWITDTFSVTDPMQTVFSVSKCTRTNRTQSNQQRECAFLHCSHNVSGRDFLSWGWIWDTDERLSEFDKCCLSTPDISDKLSSAATSMPIGCSMDSAALQRFGWLVHDKSGCPGWVSYELFPSHLGGKSGLNVCSALLVLVSFEAGSMTEVTSLVSKSFLFLRVSSHRWPFVSMGITMLLKGSDPKG